MVDHLSSALVECIRRRFAYDEQRASDDSPPSLNRPRADGVSTVGGGGPLWKQWEAAWAPPPPTSALDAVGGHDRAASPFLAVVAAIASTGDAGSRQPDATLLASAIDDACKASTDVESRWLDARLVVYAHAADQDPLVDADVAEGLRRERGEAGAHDGGSIGGSSRVDSALLYFATQLLDLATRWAAAHPAFVGSLHHTATGKTSAAPAARRDNAAANRAMLLPHNQDTPPAATQESPPLSPSPSIATVEPLPFATEDNNEATGGASGSGRWCSAPLVHTMAVTGTGLPLPIGTYLPPETVAEAEARQQREVEEEETTSAASMAAASFEPIGADAAADLAKMIRITAAVFDAPPVATTTTQVTTQQGVDSNCGIVARGITLPREQSLKMATGRAVEGRKRQRLLAATNAAGVEAVAGSSPSPPEASPMPRPPPILGAGDPSPTAAGPTATAEPAQGSATLQRPAPSSSVALHRPNPFDGDYPRNPRVPRMWFVPNGAGSLVGITMSAETFGNTADDLFGIPDAPALTVLRPASRNAGAEDVGWMRPVRLIRWVTPSAVEALS